MASDKMIMAQEDEFTAPTGCVLVRTEPPAEKENGIHIPLPKMEDYRPDRGEIVAVDDHEDYGLVAGMHVVYDRTEATKVGENLWGVPVKSVLAEINKQ